MRIDGVVAHYNRALEAIEHQHRGDPRGARVAAAGAYWFALSLLDEERPPNWLRSKQRNRDVDRLDAMRDEFSGRQYRERDPITGFANHD